MLLGFESHCLWENVHSDTNSREEMKNLSVDFSRLGELSGITHSGKYHMLSYQIAVLLFQKASETGVTRVTALSSIKREFSVCCSRLSHICYIYLLFTSPIHH